MLPQLADCTVREVLTYRPDTKGLCVLADTPTGEQMVLWLDRLAMHPEFDGMAVAEVQQLLGALELPAASSTRGDAPPPGFTNDKYQSFNACCGGTRHNWFKVSTMRPATQEVIDKMRAKDAVLVKETARLYEQVVLPWLDGQARADWIDNVIEKRAEAERLLLEDEDEHVGFVLHPDMKWSGSIPSLYCLAICKRRDLRSLRDITPEHIPLLRNIRDKCCAEIQRRFGVPANKLRLFLHYPPSFYHLHVHIVHVDANSTAGFEADRAHLLDTVIQNVEMCPDYFRRVTMEYKVVRGMPLYGLLADRKADAPDGHVKINASPT